VVDPRFSYRGEDVVATLDKGLPEGVDITTKSDCTARWAYSPDHHGKLSRCNQPTGSGKGGKRHIHVVRGLMGWTPPGGIDVP
jgi:hypothetical protein